MSMTSYERFLRIPNTVSLENFKAIVAAVKEAGKY